MRIRLYGFLSRLVELRSVQADGVEQTCMLRFKRIMLSQGKRLLVLI